VTTFVGISNIGDGHDRSRTTRSERLGLGSGARSSRDQQSGTATGTTSTSPEQRDRRHEQGQRFRHQQGCIVPVVAATVNVTNNRSQA
jgi:hypothetical protein